MYPAWVLLKFENYRVLKTFEQRSGLGQDQSARPFGELKCGSHGRIPYQPVSDEIDAVSVQKVTQSSLFIASFFIPSPNGIGASMEMDLLPWNFVILSEFRQLSIGALNI